MSAEQLAAEALALPLLQRLALAQKLWRSIDPNLLADEEAALAETIDRDRELSNRTATGREHSDVMTAARRAIGCL